MGSCNSKKNDGGIRSGRSDTEKFIDMSSEEFCPYN